MPKHQKMNKNPNSIIRNPMVVVAILGCVGTIMAALLASPFLTKLIERIPTSTVEVTFTPTIVPTLVVPTPTLTSTPTPVHTFTPIPNPTNTPLPILWSNLAAVKYIWSQVETLPKDTHPCPFLWSLPDGKENILTAYYTSEYVHSEHYALKAEFLSYPGALAGWGVGCLPSYNASKFKFVTFWLKGTNIGQTFECNLKDMAKDQKGVSVMVNTTDWERVTIPLESFAGVDLTALENFNLGFTEAMGSVTIYVDDFEFSNQ
jgi:hypothetical protein